MSLINLQYMLKYAREKKLYSNANIMAELSYAGVNTKRKIHISCEKGAQITILANKLAPQ